jgi:sarcosine oxidase subunit gamma
LSEATIATAWNVQGSANSSPLRAEVQRIAGVALPSAPNTTSQGAGVIALWLGPQSWLLVAADAAAFGNFAGARDALNAAGGALFDVSASRIAYVIEGPRAVDVLAAGCPLDFDPRLFGAGQCRQSLYGRVPAMFYRQATTPACTVLVARSFARDTWHSLCTAAAPYGYTVRAASRFT